MALYWKRLGDRGEHLLVCQRGTHFATSGFCVDWTMNALTDIKLITMDLDDTVWPCDSVIERAESILMEWLRIKTSRIAANYDVDSLRQHRYKLMEQRPQIAHDLTRVRLTSLRLLMDEFGYLPSLAEEAMHVFIRVRNQVCPYPDALPVLRVLSGEYFLVSVTNGNADVDRTPLKDCFHLSLNAAQVGAAKPAPALFNQAIAWARVEPACALHVGDDPQRDVLAAHHAGMRSVWMNRTKSEWPEELLPEPDASVTDFYELEQQLRG